MAYDNTTQYWLFEDLAKRPVTVQFGQERAELQRLPAAPRVSPHDVCLVGAVPGSLELGAGLSPQMWGAADAAEIVRQRVADRGFAVRRCTGRRLESNWWDPHRDNI